MRNETKGKNNVNWKGGIFEYPNHYQMKKNRIFKMNQKNWRCELCGKKAIYIHHKDKTKHNHKLSNLMAVCSKCHSIMHDRNKTKNPDYMKNYQKKYQPIYYQKNKNKLNKISRTYYYSHKEKHNKYMKKYRQENKDKLKQYQKEYRMKNISLK